MKVKASFLTLASATVSLSKPMARQSTSFVKVDGQSFALDGQPYTVFGYAEKPAFQNSYWVGLNGLTTDEMDVTFKDIFKTGGTTVRTWGFNEVTSASGDYYQLWNGSTPTINYGSTGLGNFDNVVAAAKANNIRLIVTLTNNWSDYGGMDIYASPTTTFYSDPEVIAAFQDYVKVWVERYVEESTIFGWELVNEPRCTGSTSATSGTCTTTTITDWVKTMSGYIKSLDSNHLGWFNWPDSTDFAYDGSQGIDFDANLAIDTIDFGTFHYTWDKETPSAMVWGQEWIENHRKFGVSATQNQTTTYENWYSTVIDGGLTGVLIWQAGSNLTSGPTPNDGFTIYPDTPVYYLEKQYSARLRAKN
ncbi:glycoside hydrolase family 5 protein [Suillus lakei]|nr:glycoside hydrolase family 5 protein [Suillus lakei]